MRKFMLFFALGLFFLNLKGQDAKVANSLLWKITAPNGEESYLFGTYHLAGSDFLEEKSRIKERFNNSEKVVVETVLDSARLLMLSTKYMMMPETSLQELLDSSDYALLKEKVKDVIGYDVSAFSNLKPMVLAGLYTVSLAKKLTPQEMIYQGQPLDFYLANMAKKMRKEVVPLETMEEQMQLLYNAESVEKQAEDLIEMIKSDTQAEVETRQIIVAYHKENLNSMLGYSDSLQTVYGEMNDLLKDRNVKWVKTLLPVLDSGGAFIAVGALHLPGADGLINLLEQENYTLSPVLPVYTE